jgi:GntR family transcriptional regulator
MPVKKIPKYIQIKDHLLQGIAARRFTDRLPSENQLSRKFSVSRMTARKALDEIDKEGFAERVPGKGTFVKDRLDSQGYFRIRPSRKHGLELNVKHSSRVLELRAVPPPVKVAAKLGNPDQVILARRLHYFDDKPVRYEIRYLRSDLCGAILKENLEVDSIHEILVLFILLVGAILWFFATAPSKWDTTGSGTRSRNTFLPTMKPATTPARCGMG